MKNKKLLNILLVCPIALTTTTSLVSISSCSNTSMWQELETATINEFKQLCKIPHPSDTFLHLVPYKSNILNLSNYIMKRVEKLIGVKVWQDKYANLFFDVPYNDESLKDVPRIALQGHMDMVFAYDSTQYEEGKAPDPLTTQIDLVEDVKDGKRVLHSRNYKTTIGADNGIGVAAILAMLQNPNFKHGNLRIIFTSCEENAMQGSLMMVEGHKNNAGEIDYYPTCPELLTGCDYVLNMDSGIGDTICVSCSGAVGSRYRKICDCTSNVYPNKYELKITGFVGGHSGESPRHQLGSAVKAGTEIMSELMKTNNIQISEILTPGTNVYNTVASNFTIYFASENDISTQIQTAINTIKSRHSDETQKYVYWKDIPDVHFDVTNASFDKALSVEDSKKIIDMHDALPYGPDGEYEDRGLKTSSNVGPTTLSYENGKYTCITSTYSRSDDDDRITAYKQANMNAASTYGFEYGCDAQFHPWVEDTNKKLFNLVAESIKINTGRTEIKPSTGHGAIEPAIWSWAIKNVQKSDNGNCVGIGVSVVDEHLPTESILVDSIQTTMKVTEYILLNASKLA